LGIALCITSFFCDKVEEVEKEKKRWKDEKRDGRKRGMEVDEPVALIAESAKSAHCWFRFWFVLGIRLKV